jgi:hypothetical protein
MPIAGYLHHRVVADGEEAPRGVVHERRRQRGHHDGGQPIAAANPLSYTKSPVVPGRLSSAASAVALIARVSAVPPASPMLPCGGDLASRSAFHYDDKMAYITGLICAHRIAPSRLT